jgi:hypothetical protein
MARSYTGLTDEAVGNQSQSRLSHAIVGKVSLCACGKHAEAGCMNNHPNDPANGRPLIKAAGHSIALPTNIAMVQQDSETKNIYRSPMSLTFGSTVLTVGEDSSCFGKHPGRP